MACKWCITGWIKEDHVCGKCGRSDNFDYEVWVQDQQRKQDETGDTALWNAKPIRKAIGYYDTKRKASKNERF